MLNHAKLFEVNPNSCRVTKVETYDGVTYDFNYKTPEHKYITMLTSNNWFTLKYVHLILWFKGFRKL